MTAELGVLAPVEARAAPTAGGAIEYEILRPAGARRSRTMPRPVRRAIGPLSTVLAWYVLSATGVLPPEVLAAPTAVLRRAWDMTGSGELPAAIAVSGGRVLSGFGIGASVGTGLALLAGLFRAGEDLVDSTVGMLRTLPYVGLIPLFIIWLGIGEEPKIALVALAVTFPLYFNIYAGIRGVDAQLVEAATMLGLRRWGLVRHVILPGCTPSALVGLRYALGSAWLALVFAEQVNAAQGVGYLMANAEQFFQTDVIVVCLVVYAVLGLLTDLIVRLGTRYLLAWRASYEGE